MGMFQRINPVTGEVASEAQAMKASDMAAIAEKAQQGFETWSKTGPNARRAVLLKAASILESRVGDFIEAMMAETGATQAWCGFNNMLAGSMLREAASITTQISGEVIPSDGPGCLAMAVRQPVGVILGIAPWNAPIILGTRAISTALACGNSVILKASEVCPRTHEIIIECLAEAGFPENVVNVVTNAPEDAPEVVGALIDHPAVKRINFTGSTEVGRIIAKRAAEHLKPCLLELGGKAPLIVLEDADLDEAVKAADFQTIKKVNALIDDALSKGATLLAGGKGESVVMDATVLDNVTSDMRIYSEESFGPIVAMIRAKDEADAVRIANDSEYGLSASVFTQNAGRGLKIASQIHSGICHVNGATVHDEAQMPFGGVGASGYGRFGGKAGIDSFTELRWITVETEPGHFPI